MCVSWESMTGNNAHMKLSSREKMCCVCVETIRFRFQAIICVLYLTAFVFSFLYDSACTFVRQSVLAIDQLRVHDVVTLTQ